MSRKKIALFSTGWASNILSHFLYGIKDEFESLNLDTYLFLSYANYSQSEEDRAGEFQVFHLPDMKDFDGAVILSNLCDFPGIVDDLVSRCNAAGIPVISYGIMHADAVNVLMDNASGMNELTEHLIKKHGIRNIVFIAGTADNSDSNERLEAVRRTALEHGLSFTEENVVYTNWEFAKVAEVAKDFAQSGKLPEAFVCANDEMAMVMSTTLEDYGIRSPEDILITGFDNLPDSSLFYPSITSVDTDYRQYGKVCARTMLDLLNGKAAENLLKLPSRFVSRESCGCVLSPGAAHKRLRVTTDTFKLKRKQDRNNWHIFYLESQMTKCESVEELRTTLSDVFSQERFMEGDNFHILFDAGANKTLTAYDRSFEEDRNYSDHQDVIFSVRNGIVQNIRNIKATEIVPGISEDDPCHMYVIIPIHDGPHKIGFAVFADCYEEIDNKEIMRFMDKINASLINSKKSIYLRAVNEYVKEMSNIDSLTGVKNRSAYETRLADIQDRISKAKITEFGIVLFDVNNLKRINDELGHYMGDEYLKNACRLICMTYKNSPVYRIGGDEFVVVLEGHPYEQREQLMEAFVQKMDKIKKDDLRPEEKVSIAYGMAVYEGTEDRIDAVVKRADELMYATKKRMKLAAD